MHRPAGLPRGRVVEVISRQPGDDQEGQPGPDRQESAPAPEQPQRAPGREQEDRRQREDPVMAERHVEQVDPVRLGVLVERVQLQGRLPDAAFVAVFLRPERLIRQIELAEFARTAQPRRPRAGRSPPAGNRGAFAWDSGRAAAGRATPGTPARATRLHAVNPGEESGRRESPAGELSFVPDPQELVEREEGTEGADRVIVQRLGVRQEIRAEGRGDQAEDPGPVVDRVAVEHPREEDQEDPERDRRSGG